MSIRDCASSSWILATVLIGLTWSAANSPLMGGDWLNQSPDAGLITVGNKRMGKLVLDFRDPARPRRAFIVKKKSS